jgi:hypothetical protein
VDGAASRWRDLFSLLNALERRDESDSLAAWSTLSAWLAEVGGGGGAPPCPGCAMPLRRIVELVACTVCLGVYHRRCLPDGRPCPCEVLDRQVAR